MNREIKFRGKRKDNGEWVYGCITFGDKPPMARMYGLKGYIAEIIPETVGQSTGLCDKKRTKEFPDGQPIYEGDILKDDCDEIGIVRFGKLPLDKSGDCVCTYLAYYVECKGKLGEAPTWECQNIGDWMEVIGTIHDDTKLMEKQE
jgi:hypothetical protein